MLFVEKVRVAVAGVSLSYPLETKKRPANRAAKQAAHSQTKMQDTPPPIDYFPNAPTFDGVDDKLDMPYAPELNPASFTVEMWAMVQGGSGYQSILASVGGSPLEGRKGYLFCVTPTRQWQFWVGNGEPKAFWKVLTGPQIKQGVWTHLAGVYDRRTRTMAFYVNGREVGRQMDVQYQPNDRNPTYVGAGATGQGTSPCFFCGKIAEVHVWDRVLTPTEIQALSNQQSIEVKAEPIIETDPESTSADRNTRHFAAQPTAQPNIQTQPTVTGTDSSFPNQSGQGVGNAPNVNPTWSNPTIETPLARSSPLEQPLAAQQPTADTSAPDPQSVLWQIGKPGQGGTPAATGAWTLVYNYTIGTESDPVNHPTIPSCLVPTNVNTIPNSTSQLNIHFVLSEDYTEGQLVLCYDRYGSGEDNLFLDGQPIAKTPGAERGKLKQSQIPLGFVQKGSHTISITTSNSADSAHVIDYIQLKTLKPMLSNLTSGLLSSGNAQSGGNQGSQGSQGQGGLLSPVTGVLGQATGALGGVTGLVGGLTGGEGGGPLGAVTGLVGGLAGGDGGPLGAVTGLVGGLTGGDGGPLGAVTGLVGGLTGGEGGPLGAVTGLVGGVAGGLPLVGGLVGGGGGGGGLPLVGDLLGTVGGVAGGLPLVGGVANSLGGVAGGLPLVGGLLGGGGGAGGRGGSAGMGGQGGQLVPGAASNQAIVQLAQILSQMNALMVQMTQILNQLAASANQSAGGGMVSQQQLAQLQALANASPQQLAQLQAMGMVSPQQLAQLQAMGHQVPGMGNVSPQQLAQLQAMGHQVPGMGNVSPQQLAQLQAMGQQVPGMGNLSQQQLAQLQAMGQQVPGMGNLSQQQLAQMYQNQMMR
ncbi:LamG-like jellyroll fold domain-containing protein [Aerosakkonema funiforme]|uniref:LamG-like jellyroll fold domain-containing protein n=1 Tax=Aerosakkonema funiforme FACHB-1375 TaxID=2949571 RepID=A0A926ZM99_9CYAN|nr:LamG-like jellyroll fold domain-containing protein [Aerosakkonema funiforme]MBD2185871.1 hypothetical protein [Aerosakkonema funiforme FACHB-1375]